LRLAELLPEPIAPLARAHKLGFELIDAVLPFGVEH
jgi:hypothetical protein